MSQFLKQSTAATLAFGPFLDATDGSTAETALTIAQADIRLSKNGGAFAQSNNAAGATHMENGYYSVPLDTTDSNTLGRLRVAVSESGALPVWQDFMVVPANVWDSLFGADLLQVHAAEITNDLITAAAIATGAIDADAIAADAITAAKIAADVGTEIADAVLSRGVSNVEDTADTTSLAAIVLAILESSVSGTTWTIRKVDGTTFVTKTLTTDPTAVPVTGVT